MATPYIDYDHLYYLASDDGYSEHPQLKTLSSVFLLSACLVMRQRWLWQNPIDPIDDNKWQEINDMINQAESDLMTSFGIGTLLSSIANMDSNDNLLRCNGQSVAIADYPLLASVVPSSWIVGPNIVIPDLDDHSVHGDYPNVGDIVGENDVTLDISQIPSHNHTQNPHSHTEIIPAVTTALGGEIPATASIVAPVGSTTGLATATNNPSGGDGSHNNIPLSVAVIWYVIAK